MFFYSFGLYKAFFQTRTLNILLYILLYKLYLCTYACMYLFTIWHLHHFLNLHTPLLLLFYKDTSPGHSHHPCYIFTSSCHHLCILIIQSFCEVHKSPGHLVKWWKYSITLSPCGCLSYSFHLGYIFCHVFHYRFKLPCVYLRNSFFSKGNGNPQFHFVSSSTSFKRKYFNPLLLLLWNGAK